MSAAYRVDDGAADDERRRLAELGVVADRGSARTLLGLGLGPGWRVLEVGAGDAGLARWLAAQVAPGGEVLAVDVDDRFLGAEDVEGLRLLVHDITAVVPGPGGFDVAHARAVLEHVPERERALRNMVDAVRPGGWVVLEDTDWTHFDAQPLPEPFATLHRTLQEGYVAAAGYDPHLGGRLHRFLADAGLVEVDLRAGVTAMHGGTSSAEWYVRALARSVPMLVESGAVDADLADAAIAQGRDPSFLVQGPVAVTAWGRRPA